VICGHAEDENTGDETRKRNKFFSILFTKGLNHGSL